MSRNAIDNNIRYSKKFRLRINFMHLLNTLLRIITKNPLLWLKHIWTISYENQILPIELDGCQKLSNVIGNEYIIQLISPQFQSFQVPTICYIHTQSIIFTHVSLLFVHQSMIFSWYKDSMKMVVYGCYGKTGLK